MPPSRSAWSPTSAEDADAVGGKALDVALRRRVSHISTFIAGATRANTAREAQGREQVVAEAVRDFREENRSSRAPTTMMSRSRESSMWPILSGTRVSHISVCTGWPEAPEASPAL